MSRSLTETLFGFWRRLSPLPGGRRLFSRVLGRLAPYSGSIGATVTTLEPGHAVVELRDRRKVRNHLDSIHAVAILNLGELATGLATITALPRGARGIVVQLSCDYHKKARGTLTAECRVAPIDRLTTPTEQDALAPVRDASGATVATVQARWLLSPE